METRETANDYQGTITPLDNANRLILCKDGIQWITQRRKGNRWQATGFYRRRDVLLSRLRLTMPNMTRQAEDTIAALPALLL